MIGYLDSPIGLLRLHATQRLLTGVELVPERTEKEQENEIIRRAKQQITQYFAGNLQQFSVAFRYPKLSPFAIAVLDALQEIPYGQTRTYGQIAAQIGRPCAARAVGQAVGRNPLLLFVPCHRVVAQNGLGGFHYGAAVKQQLLALEHKKPEE